MWRGYIGRVFGVQGDENPLLMNNRSLFISSNCSPRDSILVPHKPCVIHVTSLFEIFLSLRNYTP